MGDGRSVCHRPHDTRFNWKLSQWLKRSNQSWSSDICVRTFQWLICAMCVHFMPTVDFGWSIHILCTYPVSHLSIRLGKSEQSTMWVWLVPRFILLHTLCQLVSFPLEWHINWWTHVPCSYRKQESTPIIRKRMLRLNKKNYSLQKLMAFLSLWHMERVILD
jgi:hypothetical protein